MAHNSECPFKFKIFEGLQPDETFNDGTLGSATKWKTSFKPVPHIFEGTKILLNASFDFSYGGVGLDNIVLQTQQK